MLLIRLERAHRRNAIDLDSCTALTSPLRDADADPEVRAIVLTGVERDFCTGADAVSSNAVIAERRALDYRFATSDFNQLFLTWW